MKLILCLILLLFPIKINAEQIDFDIYQDEYNNLIITSNNEDCLNDIINIEFYDGLNTYTLDLQNIKSDLNNKTLTIYSSTFIDLNIGNYQVHINTNDYGKLRIDEIGCTIDKTIVSTPNDVIVTKNENGLEIKSKIYNYIHGLTLNYQSEYSLETYSYIQFSKNNNFEDSIIYENTYSLLPFSMIYIDNDYYCINISNDALKSMGLEEDIHYYVQIQSANFKDKSFGSYLLVEKEEVIDDEIDKEENIDDVINDENINDEIIDNPIVDKEENQENETNKKKDDSDLYIAIAGFIIVLIISGICYILYEKSKLKK